MLWGGEEPDWSALQSAIEAFGPVESFSEYIWCGFGEPSFRLDLIQEAAPRLRSRGARIRLNTNGHACLIHRLDVLRDLSECIDAVSISLNAPDMETYIELCQPDAGGFDLSPHHFWDSMIDFMSRAPEYFKETQASVVGFSLKDQEIERCRQLAISLGIQKFRVR